MIRNENEVCKHLAIPSIPKKEWDGKSHFKRGVGIVEMDDGNESCVVVRFMDDDKEPCVIKTFDTFPFVRLKSVFVIPQYMVQPDYDNMNLEPQSVEKMKLLEQEAQELEQEDLSEDVEKKEHEYYFSHIHNDDEAKAYIKAYNKQNKINAKTPKSHQDILMRLSVIWMEEHRND